MRHPQIDRKQAITNGHVVCIMLRLLCRCELLHDLTVPAYPYDLVLDEDGKCLFVEAMPLLNHESTVQAERHGKKNIFASIQQIVNDSDQYFMRFAVAKMRCNAC